MSKDEKEIKVEDLKPTTDTQYIQKVLYDLLNENLFNIEGLEMQVEGQLPEVFVAKSEMIDCVLSVLNKLGEELEKDREKKS